MPPSPLRLAIVTGAASGLGREFCWQLARTGGWHVVAVDVDSAGLAELIAEVERSGGGNRIAQAEAFDVTDGEAWLDLRRRLQVDWPRLDLLVNNAGICMSAEVGDGEISAWRRVFEVNYLGVLQGCHAMVPWLKKSAAHPFQPPAPSPPSANSQVATRNSQPSLINVASITAFLPTPAMGAYAASKAAVVALSEAMYAELRPHGVHVTVVAPGFFRTRLLASGAFTQRRHRAQAEQLSRSAKINAEIVARESLAAAARGQLYLVLGSRARWFWRWKRSAPTSLLKAVARRYRGMMRGREGDLEGD